MRLSGEARKQVDDLRAYYRQKKRPEALRNLAAALAAVDGLIAQGKTFAAPRPYPGLARTGELWVEAQPYWIACRTERPRSILAVFYATNDILGRHQRPPD